MPKKTNKQTEAKSYNHGEEHPQRPDIGTEPHFKKKKPPVTYRYDSSLSPELNWDENPAREEAEALIEQILAAEDLETAKIAARKLKAIGEPFLNWTGKAERLSFQVPTLPLFVHERLSTRAIIETLKSHKVEKGEQLNLFNDPKWSITDQILRAYEYHDKWVNRMILGDSLVTMNSLLQYEGMGGKVQMIYIDPPYGVKFGSNFQPFVRKRDVKHNDDDDFTREPEMVQAYRDTWELGLHSYLSYLRDRLLLARELLTDSGSVFVQISDENVHHVRELMDEVFGGENFVSQIAFKTTAGKSSNRIDSIYDIILWYSKNNQTLKFRPIFVSRSQEETDQRYCYLQLPDGTNQRLSNEQLQGLEIIPEGKRFRITALNSQGETSGETSLPFEWNGQTFYPPKGRHWSIVPSGLTKLGELNRLILEGKSLCYKRFLSDYPISEIKNIWMDTGGGALVYEKIYVVQTSTKVIQRCLLMTTDPGDLVLDITCLRKGTKILIPHQPTNSPPLKGGQGGVKSQIPGIFPPNPPDIGGALEALEIEKLQPGDYVIGHDLQPHRILRTISKTHQGKMIGIRHHLCQQILWVTGDHRVLCQKRTTSYGGDRNWEHIPKNNFGLAREMRKEATPAEAKLWQEIKGNQLGVKFRRQHPIGRYITDFYAREKGCIVEVDGDSHYRPDAIVYDQERDTYLNSLGLNILRFNNQEIYHNLTGILETIKATLAAVEPSEDHYKEWRRADTLKIGDIVYFGREQIPCEIKDLESEITTETVYDLEIETVHSFITEVCTVHNCGSGTTAYVAEQWGRRWITCDVSRVPLALARQRLLTATFPWYQLKDNNSPAGGFIYKRKQNSKGEEIGGIVPHITLKSIANNEPPESEILVDRPEVDNSIVRVCSPFTIEGTIPPPVEMEDEPESAAVVIDNSGPYEERMLEILRKSPVLRLSGNRTITLNNVRQPTRTQNLSAEAMVKASDLEGATLGEVVDEALEANLNQLPLSQKPVAFLFGPENGAIAEQPVYRAAGEAYHKQYAHLFVLGFAIAPSARQFVENCQDTVGIPATYIQATPDLLMGDLLKNMRSSQIFSVCGLPEIRINPIAEGKYQVELLGLDVFDPVTMKVDSEPGRNVPAWFLDTDYNGLCFHVNQAFFPRTGAWDSIKKALKGTYEESVWEHLAGTTSAAFAVGEHRQIAVKVIDDRGNELLVVKSLN
jgi:very-short-patch-repair endonuclease/DNA modification methylase